MKPLTEPGRFRIRQAGMDEFVDLARMKAQSWRESYDFDESVFAYQDEAVERSARNWAESASRGIYFWAVIDTASQPARMVGVANACPARDAGGPTPLELAMFYLLEVAKGTGIADRLLEMTIGDAPAYLWVLENNQRAIAFYRRHGFEPDGARKPLAAGLGDEIRMVRG